MPISHIPYQIALVQASPILFDLEASIQKVADWAQQAKAAGAKLVLFPEAFLPCYPRGLSFGTVVGSRSPEGRLVWQRYYNNTLEVKKGDPHFERLAAIAQELAIYLAIGIIERSGGTLYCTFLILDPEGNPIYHHRKLKPTAAERIIWGEGKGDDLKLAATELGKMGGLICWENYMPLARMALYEQQIELYLAPTADQRDRWQASMQHIALEGRCFVLACNQFVRKKDYPPEYQAELASQAEIMSRGGSVVFSPLGERLAGPLWDKEGLLLATIDPNLLSQAKLDFDVVGHYARPDVFEYAYKLSEG
ncbi:MAG: carbon-nitrogen hydrolase family protein [Bacteroidota bacterium]